MLPAQSIALANWFSCVPACTSSISRVSLTSLLQQVTQGSWALEPVLPSLAGFIRTNKKAGFSWVCWVHRQSNKTHRVGFTWIQNPDSTGNLGSGTQLTQVTCVLELNLLAQLGSLKHQKLGFSWVCWVHIQSNKIHRAEFTGFWNPAYPAQLS